MSACNSQKSDWLSAKESDTIGAYREFIIKHPNSSHSEDAAHAIDVLNEADAWKYAHNVDSKDAYLRFISTYPNGKHANEAEATYEARFGWRNAPEDYSKLMGYIQDNPGEKYSDRVLFAVGKLCRDPDNYSSAKTFFRDYLEDSPGDVLAERSLELLAILEARGDSGLLSIRSKFTAQFRGGMQPVVGAYTNNIPVAGSFTAHGDVQ